MPNHEVSGSVGSHLNSGLLVRESHPARRRLWGYVRYDDRNRKASMSMKVRTFATLLAIALCPVVLAAQEAKTDGGLSDTQMVGQRLFLQRCGVCHLQPTYTSKPFGPTLYKDIVQGKEVALRAFIANGSKRMPGFKYELDSSQIAAIVEYLKTVPKPSGPQSPNGSERGGA
jgi:mono/diheme cytochrome c family protein